MKKVLLLLLTIGFFASCDDSVDSVIYDNVNGQTGVSFADTFTSVIVPEEGVTVSVDVQVTTISDMDRTFAVAVNEDSTGSSEDYIIGNIVVPANSHIGTLDVTFDNFDNLEELMSFTLILDLVLPNGEVAIGAASTTFNYLKKVICNDVTLTINEDAYADERNWRITDSSGAIVYQCSDFADCPTGAASGSIPAMQYVYQLPLVDGCYTFIIEDSFGDGLEDGNITGNYTLSCSIIVYATGEGNFGSSVTTNFCVNQ